MALEEEILEYVRQKIIIREEKIMKNFEKIDEKDINIALENLAKSKKLEEVYRDSIKYYTYPVSN